MATVDRCGTRFDVRPIDIGDVTLDGDDLPDIAVALHADSARAAESGPVVDSSPTGRERFRFTRSEPRSAVQARSVGEAQGQKKQAAM
jgi:hypothetical protein